MDAKQKRGLTSAVRRAFRVAIDREAGGTLSLQLQKQGRAIFWPAIGRNRTISPSNTAREFK